MKTFLIILGIVLVVAAVVLIVLSIVGKRMQKKQNAQRKQMDAAAQTMSILVIDKRMLRLKDAGLPSVVLEQTPKYMRIVKMPIVKAKIGPKVLSLVAEKSVYELIPIKTTVKATISGIYITKVKSERGALLQPKKKKGFLARAKESAQNKNVSNTTSKKK